MPASHEQVPNRSLSGKEVAEIIEKDVHSILTRDGMFTENIAFRRVAYEVRVSLHMDNPMYPEHVTTILSRPQATDQIALNPGLGAIEAGPLKLPLSEDEMVFSEERTRSIASPNAARVEHDLPILVDKIDQATGQHTQKKITYTGDKPDPATVGNIVKDTGVSVDQRQKWDRLRKVGA